MTKSAGRSKAIDAQITALKKMKGKAVEAGWFDSDRYAAGAGENAGMSVARVARINEFGATVKRGNSVIIIPARPFMRGAWSMFRSNRQQIQEVLAKKMVEGKIEVNQALGQIGHALEGYIRLSIVDGNWVKNADYTVAKKGFDKPLIETSHMQASVNSKVS